jgi:hypothetical protein
MTAAVVQDDVVGLLRRRGESFRMTAVSRSGWLGVSFRRRGESFWMNGLRWGGGILCVLCVATSCGSGKGLAHGAEVGIEARHQAVTGKGLVEEPARCATVIPLDLMVSR